MRHVYSVIDESGPVAVASFLDPSAAEEFARDYDRAVDYPVTRIEPTPLVDMYGYPFADPRHFPALYGHLIGE